MGRHDFGSAWGDGTNLKLRLDAAPKRLHVGDDAHRSVALFELLEGLDGGLERGAVERSEALVEQEGLDGEGLPAL